MNVLPGRIYQAPWGRYVGHRPGILRSLERAHGFSVYPDPAFHLDTGENLPCASKSVSSTTCTTKAALPTQQSRSDNTSTGSDLNARPAGQHPDGGPGPSAPPSNIRPSSSIQDGATAPSAVVESADRATTNSAETSTKLVVGPVLTLGGLRPGSVYCIVPGRPQLEWKPCLTRDEAKVGSHVWFLASTDEASLYCPRCRLHDPQAFLELADRIYAAIASGKSPVGEVLTDHPFAKLLLRASVRRGPRAPQKADAAAEQGRDGTGTPSAMGGRAEAQPTTEPAYTFHCCPRIVLGHGLHSPVCKNFVADAEPTMPAIPRDDPKAEAGSFERVMPWRPKYRDYADWDEWRRERAAIMEYEGGVARKYAEVAANRLAGPPP